MGYDSADEDNHQSDHEEDDTQMAADQASQTNLSTDASGFELTLKNDDNIQVDT
jgi:hypothetical protein